MAKFTYSRKIQTTDGEETFSGVEFASFDEAKKAVDKGIYDRKLELDGLKDAGRGNVKPLPPSTPTPLILGNPSNNGGNASSDVPNSTTGGQG